jgi:uncharacterized membrane protein
MNKRSSLPNLHPAIKLLISAAIGAFAYSRSPHILFEPVTRLMIGWDFMGLSYIGISVITLFYTPAPGIRGIAQKQDIGHQFLYGLMVMASITCMILIALLIKSKTTLLPDKNTVTLIYLSGVVICWLMLQVIFTFHYAHMYYGDDIDNKNTHRGGLTFPGKAQPDYIDFAYFSFVIGMTFQVSDVVITDRIIRRAVLFHALIAFLFNTVVVALSVNAIVNTGN